MDPELIKQKEAFKRRAMAVPVVEKKASKPPDSVKPKAKKKKRAKPKALQVPTVKQPTNLSSNPYRILKAVVDGMGRRYTSRSYESLSLDEILTDINLTDLKADTRQWVLQALKDNPKIKYYPEVEKFLYLPSIGLDVRNRRQLLHKLAAYEREGLGGIPMSEVKEALYKPEKAVEKLEDSGDILKVTRQDKEDILFYNNREYEIDVDEEFRSLWRGVSMDGMDEGGIEKYLQNVGLGAMQGETRKRMAPSSQQKTRKKARVQKVLNTHLDSSLLKDYSEDVPRSKH